METRKSANRFDFQQQSTQLFRGPVELHDLTSISQKGSIKKGSRCAVCLADHSQHMMQLAKHVHHGAC